MPHWIILDSGIKLSYPMPTEKEVAEHYRHMVTEKAIGMLPLYLYLDLRAHAALTRIATALAAIRSHKHV